MTSSKQKSTKSKILKVVGIIASVIVGLILIVTILLLTVLEPYAERLLKKQVSKKTEELYDLNFDDLDINLITSTVRLKNIRLHFDSAIHTKQKAKGEASPFLLNLKTKELEVSGIDALEYLFSSSISIYSILIDQPEAKIIHDTHVPSKKDKKQKDLSEIINSLNIGDFNLQNAEISYHKYQKQEEAVHKIPELNLRFSDFTADSLDREDIRKMIDMDDFFISLKNQSYTTSNKSYDFHFDLFKYSMAEEELTIKAFSAIGDHTKMSKPMIVPEIQLPLFKLYGLDVLKALKTKELYLKELLIDSTYVKLLEIPDLDITVADVYRGLATFFETTKIDNLNIDRSAVSMYSRENRDVLIHKIDQVDLSIEDVFFDSLSVFDSRNNLALQDLELKIENYLFTPEQNPYTFKLARMKMRTKEDHLKLEDIVLIPDVKENNALNKKQASAQLINIQIPAISFEGIDMIRAFEHSSLDITKIAIPNSTTSIAKAFEKKSSGSGFSPEDIYKSFSFYVKEININEFLISDADFSKYPTENKVNKLHHAEQARLKLSGIHFDSVMAYQNKNKAPLAEILLQLNHYQYAEQGSPDFFRMGPFKYSSNSGNLEINNVQYESHPEYSKNKADSLVLSSKRFSVSNLDIVSAFNRGYLKIDEILLQSPQVHVSKGKKQNNSSSKENKKSQKMPGEAVFKWLNPITVESIRIVNGEADYMETLGDATNFQNLKEFSVEVKQLELSPEKMKNIEEVIPVENILVQADNYTFYSPDSIYTITLDSLFYGSQKGELTAQYFQMRPDYELHKYRVKNNIKASHRNLFSISTDQFSIKRFDLVKAYNTGQYKFGEVLLKSPELSMLQDKKVKNYQQKVDSADEQSSEQKENKEEPIDESLQKQINEYVDIFKIDSFRIEDAKFSFEILKKDSIRESQELEHLSLLIENLQLANLEANDLTDLFSVNDINLLLRNYNFVTPDSLYELRVDKLTASLAEQYIHINSVNYEPLFLIDEYADKLEYAKDRFDVSVDNIKLEGIDFDEFFNHQHYIIEKIKIDGLEGSIYRDSRVEQDPSRKPRTVQQFIKDLPIPIQVDTLGLEDASIIYSEVSKDGSGPGVTTLADTELQILNITNDSMVYTLKDEMKVDGSTKFLGESTLEIGFVFDMNHPEDLYTYEGYLEQMEFKAFNPLFTNLLFVKMESGVIEKIDFSVTATKHKSEGMMYFPYENLKFRLLNKDDPGNPGFLLKTANWSLNNILIKSNNPGNLFNSYRKGEISVERNYSKSVFNHMGNSLLSGFISSTIPEPLETILNWVTDLP